MTTHSNILAWRILWTEEPGRHSPQGCKEWDTTEQLTFSLFFFLDVDISSSRGTVASVWTHEQAISWFSQSHLPTQGSSLHVLIVYCSLQVMILSPWQVGIGHFCQNKR